MANPPVEEGLLSKSPTDRSRAAAGLLQDPFAVSSKTIIRAVQAETVPGIRRILNDVLRLRQKEPLEMTSGEMAAPGTPIEAIDVDVASWIRHELSPAIGWVRLAADEEVADFESSLTNEAIQKLQRRVDGLVSLIRSTEAPKREELQLSDLLRTTWPHPSEPPPVIEGLEVRPDLKIESDFELLSLLFSNAFQNAIDASIEATGSARVLVTCGASGGSYWVRISNPFAGNAFSLADVVAPGRSTKQTHRGQGLMLITSVASRLDLRVTLEGQSGTAVFTVIGSLADG